MSLAQRHWGLVAGAAVLAVGVPYFVLRSPAKVDLPPIAQQATTRVKFTPASDLSIALSAPLFAPGRTPVAEDGAQGPDVPAALPAPTLVGLISRGRVIGIALVKQADGTTTNIAPGQSVDGWQLVSVSRSNATFSRGSERATVALDFKNKIAATPEASPVPPPSAPPSALSSSGDLPPPSDRTM